MGCRSKRTRKDPAKLRHPKTTSTLKSCSTSTQNGLCMLFTTQNDITWSLIENALDFWQVIGFSKNLRSRSYLNSRGSRDGAAFVRRENQSSWIVVSIRSISISDCVFWYGLGDRWQYRGVPTCSNFWPWPCVDITVFQVSLSPMFLSLELAIKSV